MNRISIFLTKNVKTIILLFCISGIPHAINMLHFPYFENDEGTYASQAWSIISSGRLAPYTYWYDHAPAGWIFIMVWTILTGGFFTFGFSLNSGRVFMLVLHIIESILVYGITIKITRDKLASVFAVLIFSLSPLAIYFQRRILLDNIMIFWFLLSLFFLYYYNNRLRYILLSAVTAGIAIVTKESAVFFIPVLIYSIFQTVDSKHRAHAIALWICIIAIILSIYFLYAILKGELFPAHTFLGGTHNHVSLLQTLQWQTSREGGGIVNISKSTFWQSMKIWLQADPLIMVLGIISIVINILIGVKNTRVRLISLVAVSYLVYLLRGGLVIEFYIIPLIPLFAINIGIFLFVARNFVENLQTSNPFSFAKVFVFFAFILFIALDLQYASRIKGQNLYLSDQTKPQLDALNWIIKNIKPETFFVIDNYGYIEMHSKKSEKLKNAEWYWKVDLDPAVRVNLLRDNLQNIDYIALTPQMEHDLVSSGLDFTHTAWLNSKPLAKFWNDGWGVSIWATDFPHRILSASWNSYKEHFIKNGRTLDPYNNNSTTSEAQSYSLLRSVLMNDRGTFDKTYTWTKIRMQRPDGLFLWKWIGDDISGHAESLDSATDADEDISLSLLYAYKRWHDEHYFSEALTVINGIWNDEVVTIGQTPYLIAGNWANKTDYIVLNPSYLSPASYRIFALVDSHPWGTLADASYGVLRACTQSLFDKKTSVLPPEWCSVNKSSLKIMVSNEKETASTNYGFNAFRIPWRIALDDNWFHDSNAKKYLTSLTFLINEWDKKRKISTVYQHDGKIWEDYESTAAYSGDLGLFIVLNHNSAKNIFTEKILKKFYESNNNSYWEDSKNYYTQNWAWFGTALYTNNIPNVLSTGQM